MAGLGQIVFLQLKQGAWIWNISDQAHSIQGDVAEVKQQVGDIKQQVGGVKQQVAKFETKMMSRMDRLFSDGEK